MDVKNRIRSDLDELYGDQRDSRRVVLFCDDDGGIRDMARDVFVPTVFAPIGFDSFIAVPDADMAMMYLRDSGRRRALGIVCSDRNMPGMSGISLAVRLRHGRDVDEQRIPFLLVSGAQNMSNGSGVDVSVDDLIGAGIIDAALNKPFGIEQLMRGVAEAIKKRLSIVKLGRIS